MVVVKYVIRSKLGGFLGSSMLNGKEVMTSMFLPSRLNNPLIRLRWVDHLSFDLKIESRQLRSLVLDHGMWKDG